VLAMLFSWIRNQRRTKLLSEPFPSRWRTYLHGNVRHCKHLDPRRSLAVEQTVQVFVAEKNWVGGAEIDVTEEMNVTVAGQAAILVLGLKEPCCFDDVQSIVYSRCQSQGQAVQTGVRGARSQGPLESTPVGNDRYTVHDCRRVFQRREVPALCSGCEQSDLLESAGRRGLQTTGGGTCQTGPLLARARCRAPWTHGRHRPTCSCAGVVY
jgi:hypothetical protein